MSTTVTKEQAEKMGEDVRRSIELAEEQLAQHKVWLFSQLFGLVPSDYGLTGEQWRELLNQVSDIKTEQVRIGADKDEEKSTVTLVNSYPDELHRFLSRDDIPVEMSLAGQGGKTVQPMPQLRLATPEDEK